MANKNGNIKNLKPQAHALTVEEQSKGGKISAKKRRERKSLKESLLLALTTEIDGEAIQDRGINALLEKFMQGDPKVFELVRDTIGEKPTDKQEVKVVDSDWFV